MHTLAMILAGGAGSRLSVLTQKRTKPAVPFAGKYRIIDFTLSNCVNSGIFTAGICTQYRPRSLNDHIRTGQPWDLNRATGGITLLQPYVGPPGASWYQGTADAIYQNLDFIYHHHPDVVLILGGDHIYKMDYDVMVAFHLDHGADLTIATLRVAPQDAHRFGILETDEEYKVVGFEEKPTQPKGILGSMGIYAFNNTVLEEVLQADQARARSRHDFGDDIIPQMVKTHHVYAFPYRGYWVDVGTIEAYWQAHMDLLTDKPRLDLLDREWIIHTRSEERPPANIRNTATIKHSLITNGCVIEGTVEHSVLSPGVTGSHYTQLCCDDRRGDWGKRGGRPRRPGQTRSGWDRGLDRLDGRPNIPRAGRLASGHHRHRQEHIHSAAHTHRPPLHDRRRPHRECVRAESDSRRDDHWSRERITGRLCPERMPPRRATHGPSATTAGFYFALPRGLNDGVPHISQGPGSIPV
jgi:glucose-1-phosphate adenylyltransferase